jgi:hypothetical protein
MRVFKNQWFARWARTEDVSDSALFQAAAEVVTGQVEADLGAWLFKSDWPEKAAGNEAATESL